MHLHVSAVNGLISFLYIIVALGVTRLIALAHPDSKFAQGWLTLY